jgi:branched-subunit amino acid aminotransferase/4-amino-4-deoxychorismate lyase
MHHADAESFSLRGESLGVFTTFRTYGDSLLTLDYHLNRLLESAQALKIVDVPMPHQEPRWIRHELFRLIQPQLSSIPGKELRIRIIIRSLETLEICIEQLRSSWNGKTAVDALSIPALRPWPEHKSTEIEISKNARARAEANSADEALLCDFNGTVREGAWSNFFWFDSNGSLHTAGSGVLPGIVRRIVLENHPCIFSDVSVAELRERAAEAFFSNSIDGIVPALSLDGFKLPNGAPGPLTADLQAWFETYTANNIETVLLSNSSIEAANDP